MKLWNSIFGGSKPKTLSPLKVLSQDEFEKAKFKARIAFVDDEEIAHVERLRSDGYNIHTASDIENIDDFLRKQYHVVVLDIQGVGQSISPKSEGWGILKYIKNESPNVVVIMYTGAEWSITKYKDEADKADDFIGKDLEFLDFKAKLDNGIRKAFSPEFHFEIERAIISKEITNANTIKEIKNILNNYGGDRKMAISLIQKITSNQTVLESADKFLSIASGIKDLLI